MCLRQTEKFQVIGELSENTKGTWYGTAKIMGLAAYERTLSDGGNQSRRGREVLLE